MTRRVRSTSFGSQGRRQSRMAPGGQTWSTRSMPRAARQRVPMMEGDPPLEVIHYPMDDASGKFMEISGYPHPIGMNNPYDYSLVSYHQPPLAPGSAYSAKLTPRCDMSNDSWSGEPLSPASDGFFGVDLWVKGLSQYPPPDYGPWGFLSFDFWSGIERPNGADEVHFSIEITAAGTSDLLIFRMADWFGSPDVDVVLYSMPRPSGTVHIRWDLQPGSPGKSRIWINDSLVSDYTGYIIDNGVIPEDSFWSLLITPPGNPLTFDEVKVKGVRFPVTPGSTVVARQVPQRPARPGRIGRTQ